MFLNMKEEDKMKATPVTVHGHKYIFVGVIDNSAFFEPSEAKKLAQDIEKALKQKRSRNLSPLFPKGRQPYVKEQ